MQLDQRTRGHEEEPKKASSEEDEDEDEGDGMSSRRRRISSIGSPKWWRSARDLQRVGERLRRIHARQGGRCELVLHSVTLRSTDQPTIRWLTETWALIAPTGDVELWTPRTRRTANTRS